MDAYMHWLMHSQISIPWSSSDRALQRFKKITITGWNLVISVASSIRHMELIPALLTRWSTAKRLIETVAGNFTLFDSIVLAKVSACMANENKGSSQNYKIPANCWINILHLFTKATVIWLCKLTSAKMVDCFLDKSLAILINHEHISTYRDNVRGAKFPGFLCHLPE